MKIRNCGVRCWGAAGLACVGLGIGVSLGAAQTSRDVGTVAASTPAAGAASQGALPADVVRALAMPEGAERTAAVLAAGKQWMKTDAVGALNWGSTLRGSLGKVVFAMMAENPAASAEWASEKAHRGYFHPAMYAWGMADPTAAAAWCSKAPEEVRYLAFFSVGDGWLRKDRKADIAWAATLEPEADRLAAIHGIAIRYGRTDVAAAGEWIKTLKGAEVKLAATVIAADWRLTKLKTKGSKKEEVVKPWLDGLPLSDAEKAEVMAAGAPDSLGPAAAAKGK